ncbi:MAG: rhodanese-like domain-containing protein, partial [Actinomycetota bacterium]|nr:rhodanese-like domain-containing protein [Actinomycetota bacterium]
FRSPPVPSVRPLDVPADAWLLDVREPGEWAAGHVDGAHHVPMSELPARAGEVPGDREVVVVCRVGGRSAAVTAWLRAQGRRAVNLDGGLDAWAAAGRPLVSDGPGDPFVA